MATVLTKRHSYIYECMKQTRNELRSAFKNLMSHEQQIRDNKLFESSCEKKNNNFFLKETNSRRKAVVSDV